MSGIDIEYLVAGDGTVVAWGEEQDPPSREMRWGASAWTADPREDGAEHIERLAADTTYRDVRQAIREYLAEHATPRSQE